jgi:hypothetical protein
LPFRASEEDLDTVAEDMRRIPNAIAWPAAWPTNAFAERAALFYVEALASVLAAGNQHAHSIRQLGF